MFSTFIHKCDLRFASVALFLFVGCAFTRPEKQKMRTGKQEPLIISSVHENKRKKRILKDMHECEDNIVSSLALKDDIEARFDDIPLPLSAVLAETSYAQTGCYELVYSIPFSFQVAVDFYGVELEKNGWKLEIVFLSKQEYIVSCRKGNRSCVLSILPKKKLLWSCKKNVRIRFLIQY